MIFLPLCCALFLSVGAIHENVLIGIHIQADNFHKDQLTNLVTAIRGQHNDMSQNNMFACISNSVNMIADSSIHTTLFENQIPHIYSSSSHSNFLCSIEHPLADQHDYILQISASTDFKSIVLSSITSSFVERDFSIIYLHKAAVLFLKASSLSDDMSLLLKRAIQITTTPQVLPVDQAVLNHSSALLVPSRAAKAKYHSSGPCNLWWPLDGAEIMVYGNQDLHGSNLHHHVEPLIMICPQLNNFLLDSPHGQTSKKKGYKRLLVLELFNHRIGQLYPLTDSMPVITETLTADEANFEEAVQVMMTMQLPPYATHVRVRLSMCHFNTRSMSKYIDKSDCFVDLDVTLHVVWGDQVPLVKSTVKLHPMVASMTTRDLFGYALRMMGHNSGTFVEVGVNRGLFAKLMLAQWGGNRYIMVDPWTPAPEEEYVDIANAPSLEVHNNVLAEAIRNVEGFGARPVIIRDTSVGAARYLVNNTVDVVYLDGLHHYHGVMDDLAAWWPKLKRGGVLAGHDYYLMSEAKTIFTVKPAVDEFARKMGLVVFQTHDSYPTWFVFK